MILDGKLVSQSIKNELKDKVSKLNSKPCLAVIQIGNDEASNIYINSKRKSCEEVGFDFIHIKLDDNISFEEVATKIHELNNDEKVDGILMQLPIPKHLDEDKLLNLIDYNKDVDGLTEINFGKLFKNNNNLLPCTALGVIKLLKHYDIDLKCHVVIVGRSSLVGRPLINLFLQENATVTVCHSHTENLSIYTKQADILVSATGIKHLINKDMVKDDCVVVDVGINRVDGKIYGDVDNNGISNYSPVPGGVGPMTVAMLLNNVYESHLNRNKLVKKL